MGEVLNQVTIKVDFKVHNAAFIGLFIFALGIVVGIVISAK